MRIPPITPVLAGQPPDVVLAVVCDAVARASRETNARTQIWLAAKALQWLHAHAAALLDEPGGEGRQRRAYALVWRVVDARLTPTQASEMRRLPALLARAQHDRREWPQCDAHEAPHQRVRAELAAALSAPLRAVGAAQFNARLHAAFGAYDRIVAGPGGEARDLWRLLLVCHIFELITANPDLMRGVSDSFRAAVVRKRLALGQEWPFILEAYPLHLFVQ